MAAKRMDKYRLLPAGLLMALLVAGCGGGGKGNIHGQVSFKGQPLPEGQITFFGQSGKEQVFHSQIKDGAYRVEGVPAGPVKITVRTFNRSNIPQTAPPSFGKDKDKIPDLLKGFPVKLPEPGEKPPAPGKYVPIPERYVDPEKSGLEYTVIRGDQEKNLELQP
jgi:hypothetical protein